MRNHSNENEFDLHENEHASETNFHMNGFALRLVLKKRQKSTRKWPIRHIESSASESKPLQSRSRVKIPDQARREERTGPFQFERAVLN